MCGRVCSVRVCVCVRVRLRARVRGCFGVRGGTFVNAYMCSAMWLRACESRCVVCVRARMAVRMCIYLYNGEDFCRICTFDAAAAKR